MSKSHSLSAAPNKQETICGWVYLAFQLFALPAVLSWFNARLQHPMKDAEVNFLFFCINFIAVLLIFHDYLSRSASQVFQHPIRFFEAVVLGFVAYYLCAWCMEFVFSWLFPGFSNANDEAIAALSSGNFFLMAIGTVILVPLAEECFFRGLIFRNLWGYSRVAAYLVSMAAFAFLHIIGYIQSYTPLELILCFLQYLPAGLCLAWSYTKSDTIFAPIVVHALINAVGIYRLR